jgi:hypothetical protein
MKGNSYVPFMLRRGDGSTLSLDFTALGSLDSRFTFTRSTTATFINSSGYVESIGAAASNDPTKARFDYDPTTLTARGLLIEGSATNYAVSSEAFSTSYWGISGMAGSAPTATSQTNPKNTASCIQFVEDTSTGAHGAYQSMSGLTAGTVYTLSAWVKSDGTRNFASLRLTVSGGSPSYTAVWSLTDGTAGNTLTTGSPTSTARSIVAYPNGWYRIQISMACPTGFTAMIGYVNGSNTNTLTTQPQSYTGVATKGIFVWGAQMEASTSASASSYIPTTTSNAQRAADSCAILLSSFGFSTTAGTLYADWYRKNGDSGSQSGGPWSTDYASARWLGVQNAVASNTVSLSSWSGSTNIANGSTRNKAAATYGAWTGSVSPTTFCVNNSAVTSASRDFNPSTATYLTIGAGSSSAGSSPAYGVATRDWLNNSIRVIKYWPSILSNETLQSLTA